jgi:predicted site-specific integrase-resolvase
VTVRRWIKAGRIRVVQVGREARIPRAEIERMVGNRNGRLLVEYGRASGHGQKDDLVVQLERLQIGAASERTGRKTLVLSAIGSGLTASRRQLTRLLKLVCEDTVEAIALTDEDRLTRFGQDYLQTLFACFGVTLTVLDPGAERTPAHELTEEVLSLSTSFSGRLYEKRSHNHRALVACARHVMADEVR